VNDGVPNIFGEGEKPDICDGNILNADGT